jgi:hypothetical protein
MTAARDSARVHLPDLDQSFGEAKRLFGARLIHLTTPDGQWGSRPAWLDWPMHTAADMAPSAGPGTRAALAATNSKTPARRKR